MRRHVLAGLAVIGLLAGCTSGADDDVDVLAEVIDERGADTARSADDEAGDDGPVADVTDDEAAGDTDDAPGDDAAADDEEDAGTAAADPTAPTSGASEDPAPATAAPATGGSSSAPAPTTSAPSTPEPSSPAPTRPAPTSSAPEPAPTPDPRVLDATERTARGEVSSIDGDWVVTSSQAIEADAAPDPLAVEVRSSSRGADEEMSCAVTLTAPDDRPLIARGEIVVSVATTTADGTRVVPRVRLPVDVTLSPGRSLELPVRSVLLSHGPQDFSATCIAAFTP